MTKITYATKDNFKLEPAIPIAKKVSKDDMNEIKNVVNANADQLDDHEVDSDNPHGTTEENVLGTCSEDLTMSGAEDVRLKGDFADVYLKLTGNTTITFINTPSVGVSIVRTFAVESDTTETLGIANSTDEFGTYVADGTINEMVVKASNYATEGLIIRVFFSQPN